MTATATPIETQDAPLAGLRVLEFTQAIMALSAGLVLADLGADVIKVEPSPGGDPTRRMKNAVLLDVGMAPASRSEGIAIGNAA